MMMKKTKLDSGFSLMEVMVAVAIIVPATVVLVGALFDVFATTASSVSMSVANAHLASVVDEVHALEDVGEILDYTPPLLPGMGEHESIDVAYSNANGGWVPLPFSGNPESAAVPDPVEVKVTLRWMDPRGRSFRRETSIMVRR